MSSDASRSRNYRKRTRSPDYEDSERGKRARSSHERIHHESTSSRDDRSHHNNHHDEHQHRNHHDDHSYRNNHDDRSHRKNHHDEHQHHNDNYRHQHGNHRQWYGRRDGQFQSHQRSRGNERSQDAIAFPASYLFADGCFSPEFVRQQFAQLARDFAPLLQSSADRDQPLKRYRGEHAQHLCGNRVAIVAIDGEDQEIITDYFVEQVRARSKNVNFGSPIEVFERRDQRTVSIFRRCVAQRMRQRGREQQQELQEDRHQDQLESNKQELQEQQQGDKQQQLDKQQLDTQLLDKQQLEQQLEQQQQQQLDKQQLAQKQQVKQEQWRKRVQYLAFREAIKRAVVRDCALFPLTVPLTVFRLFKPRKILDMCAGWGDRLISAMLYNADCYLGVDPNSDLAPKYADMINFFTGKQLKQVNKSLVPEYSVVTKAFEDIVDEDIGDHRFDMMFSSPPYFVAENYSNDSSQSHNRYENNLEKWLAGFMFPSIAKAWNYLNPGGFYCLVLSDVRIGDEEINYTERILNFIETQANAKYYGMLKYVHDKTQQPIWIFRKMDPVPIALLNGCQPIIQMYSVRTQGEDKLVHVIREDLLMCGTVQRVVLPYLQLLESSNEFTYIVEGNDCVQAALADACKLLGKTLHLFIKSQQFTTQTHLAMIFGAKIHKCEGLSDEEVATQISTMVPHAFPIPANLFTTQLVDLYKKLPLVTVELTKLKPRRIWLTTNLLFIYHALHEALPENTRFVLVKVDKTVLEEKHVRSRTQLLDAPESLFDRAKVLPPFNCDYTLCAKMWQFIYQQAEQEDYVLHSSGV